ncbi:MAG: hypothetical protein JXR86_02875 [Spirochaetales bacterium]|nr:hypothetical protein [Spirochaetales bacterium]
MYSKREYAIGQIQVVRISDDRGSFFDIIPGSGAMVYRISLPDGMGRGRDILRYDSPEDLEENPLYRGRVLFPFNDRIPGGRYSFDNREYFLPVNDESDHSSIHGLVYNKSFQETGIRLDESSGEISYQYRIGADDFESYPFPVELQVTYRISDAGFYVNYQFANCGSLKLPVALGWHPYFRLDGTVDDWSLHCGGGSFVAVDDRLNPTGEIHETGGTELDFTSPRKIEHRDLDIALTASPSGICSLENSTHKIILDFDRELFPFVQLFIPPERDSIAIEPITAATNSFNVNGLGRLELNPGEGREGSVRISLQSL